MKTFISSLSCFIALLCSLGLPESTSSKQIASHINPHQTKSSQMPQNWPVELDLSVYSFLKEFKTRQEFCSYQCGHTLNISCHFSYSCWTDLKNLLVFWLFPGILLGMAMCFLSLFSLPFWMKYIAHLTGIGIIVELAKRWKRREGGKQMAKTNGQGVQKDGQVYLS